MATFVQIVDRGSLSSASEALDTSLSSVVRTLAGLEKSLGVRLLNRT
ncbi:MAG TPA: LysR family transcriptional regulator, partial [Burkholderiales bacterium]|nr:LysR family transcriptional regulator [Burkholderiales bacterium]